MPNDSRETRAEALQVLLPWGVPMSEREDGVADSAFWLAGGATLLLWTAVALLLTAA